MTNESPKSEQAYLEEIKMLRARISQLETEQQSTQRSRVLDSDLTASILDYLPDFVYVKDANCRMLYDNLAHARSIGVEDPSDLIGKSDFDFFPPELAERFFEDEQEIIRSGQALLNREERSIGVDGQPIWALTSKVPLHDTQGNFIGLLGITRDISQRRIIQEKLAEREAEYRLVINTMTDGLLLLGVDGKVLSSNPSAERILGLTESQLLGQTPIDPQWYLVHEDGSMFYNAAQPPVLTLHTGQPLSNAVIGIHKPDGSMSWITGSSRLLTKADDEAPYAIVVNFTDITALKIARNDLRESEERFREFAENTDVVFMLYEYTTRKLVYVSAVYDKLWGRPNSLLFENPASHFETIHPDDRALVLKAISTNKSNYDYRIVKPDGVIRWIRTQSFFIRDADNQIVRTAEVSEDITEHKFNEAEQQRAEALKSFLADASHDLNTPLAVAKTSVYLLRKLIVANQPIDEQLKYVDMLGTRIEHIRKQLDAMFTLVRLDLENAFEFRMEDVNTLLKSIGDQYAPLVAPNRQQLKLDLSVDLPPLLLDAKEIQRAIGCLVENAIAYTPAGGKITLRTRKQDNHLVIEVEDTGIGIAEEHLPRIFDRFYRVDDARNTEFGRFGLGLTIAGKIIEAHHGTIHVKSELDKGSLFSILLPLPSKLLV